MTTLYWLNILIALITLWIAYSQFNTARKKFRLDLYNKRFEILTKIIDLFLNLPDSVHIENMPEEEKKVFIEFEETKKAFFKYNVEAKFLFDKDSGIHSLLNKVYEDIFIITNAKKSNDNQSDIIEIRNHHFNAVFSAHGSLLRDLGNLIDAMGEYLNFHDSCFEKMCKKIYAVFPSPFCTVLINWRGGTGGDADDRPK